MKDALFSCNLGSTILCDILSNAALCFHDDFVLLDISKENRGAILTNHVKSGTCVENKIIILCFETI